MVHHPTFDPEQDLVVTLCIITIGVKYTGFPGAQAFSKALSELTRRLVISKVKIKAVSHMRNLLTRLRLKERGDT